MLTVTKQFRAEISHRLQNHPGACKNLHGHSYLFEITAAGFELSNGMIIDFKDLKQAIEKFIGRWDHAVLLEETDPLSTLLDPFVKIYTCSSPPTAEWMAEKIGHELNKILPIGIRIVKVQVWETTTSYATWEE